MRTATVTALLACASLPLAAAPFVRDDIITRPTPEAFSVCQDQGCRTLSTQSLDDGQWQTVRELFGRPGDAAAERRAIARVIARMEQWMGERTGTDADRPGTFAGLGRAGQMDCIDEATNTTTYLRLLEGTGLLVHHRVRDPATRINLLAWPHTTAVIEDSQGRRFAVDSWFEANGEPPHIVPLEQWRRGWKPGRP
ncbi:hypothetical protein [Thiohalobacter sp.]|uniref:hypothetical protein n=1 Tax=Thiohalobacter sp. TaxID=2025948 RepID=UPI002638E4F2|nr:hypothetical protein [Thiohalobacter sp.]